MAMTGTDDDDDDELFITHMCSEFVMRSALTSWLTRASFREQSNC